MRGVGMRVRGVRVRDVGMRVRGVRVRDVSVRECEGMCTSCLFHSRL